MKLLDFCMSDNTRNKTVFKSKIAKIAQKLPKHFEKNDPNVAQWERFC